MGKATLAAKLVLSSRDKGNFSKWMHLRDLADVGLLDETLLAKLPPPLAERLGWLLDHPEE